MRKICVFIGSRANYSSIKSVLNAVKNHPQLELQIITGASATLEKFGKVENLIKQDGFTPNYSFNNLLEGGDLLSMTKSTGLGILDYAPALIKLKPDFIVVVGDRFEMMSIVIAGVYQNIRIAHTMGGEVTGTIDESIRHAITKFSHIHFASNEDSKNRIIRMGENPESVFNTGCPRIDLVKKELQSESKITLEDYFKKNKGLGNNNLEFDKPIILVSFHPVTTEYEKNRIYMSHILKVLKLLKKQTIVLWPNADAGESHISKEIRTFREKNQTEKWLSLYKNLPTNIYIHLMNVISCLIGNSSSGIREGAYIGTPVVNIGTRQNSRLSGVNVINCNNDFESIFEAVNHQLSKGKHQSDHLYGNGNAGEIIAEILSTLDLNKIPVQKIINY